MKIPATDGKTYNGITDYINNNLRKEVLGDVNDPSDKVKVFANWWKTNVNMKLGEMYQRYDKEYVNVIGKLTQNWRGYNIAQCLGQNGKGISSCVSKISNAAVDKLNGSDYLEKNALSNLKLELDIYSAVLNEMLLDTALTNDVISSSVQRNLPAELSPVKVGVMANAQIKPSAVELNLKKALDFKVLNASNAKKDFGGFLRRLKSGDRNILQGTSTTEMPELKTLRLAIEERLAILSKIEVRDGTVLNFPEKVDSKKAIEQVEESLKAFQKKCEGITVTETQKAVLTAAVAGMQSVSVEVSRLNMALYTSKYKLNDSYEDLKSGISGSQNEKKSATRGFSPNGLPR